MALALALGLGATARGDDFGALPANILASARGQRGSTDLRPLPEDTLPLHCRADVLGSFKKLWDDTRGFQEQSMAIEASADPAAGSPYEFATSPPRDAELCQRVPYDPRRTVAIAHTHPLGADPRPNGFDCDSAAPNYVLSEAALYVTEIRTDGAGYASSGVTGTYRLLVNGSGWRDPRNWTNPAWLARCRAQSPPPSRSKRCLPDPDRLAQVRRGHRLSCP